MGTKAGTHSQTLHGERESCRNTVECLHLTPPLRVQRTPLKRRLEDLEPEGLKETRRTRPTESTEQDSDERRETETVFSPGPLCIYYSF